LVLLIPVILLNQIYRPRRVGLALEWWGILLMGSGGIPITIKPVGILLVVSAIPYFTGGMGVRGIASEREVLEPFLVSP